MVKLRSPRTRVHLPVQIRIGASSTWLSAFAINLSTSGVALAASVASTGIAASVHVDVKMVLNEGEEGFTARGEVRWVEIETAAATAAMNYRFGLQFLALGDDLRGRVEAFVRAYRSTVLLAMRDARGLEHCQKALAKTYRVLTTNSVRDAESLLHRHDVAAVVCERALPDGTATDLFQLLSASPPNRHAGRLILSDGERDVRGLESAADDVLAYPVSDPTLRWSVDRAIAVHDMRVENQRLIEELERATARLERENLLLRSMVPSGAGHFDMVGTSVGLRNALINAEQIARYDTPVHINGETGTGKELFARAIHRLSPRHAKPFIAQNCAGMTDTLLQSLLFGHRKGAFTGADRDQVGLFEAANGGTLFLDEVGEMSHALQAMCLRVLQSGEVMRMGETQARIVDVRIVSATHRELGAEVEAGRFRRDLFYRLVVFPIVLPALRERREDVSLLAAHFLAACNERLGKRVEGFTPEVMSALEQHDWPGNIRELGNEIERMCVITPSGARVAASALSLGIRRPTVLPLRDGSEGLPELLEQTERGLVASALAEAKGNKTQAAKKLKISRQNLQQRLARLGLSAEKAE